MRALVAAGVVLLLASSARADVVLDGSFGSAGPVTPVGTEFPIPEELGRRQGANLFHSFSELSLAPGEVASFSAVAETSNVIARVTGGLPSRIAGTLRSLIPAADFWLVNPSGVVFTETGALQVQGSFHASTADALRFEDAIAFPTGTVGEPVLSAAMPAAFGFLPEAPGSIRVERATLTVPTGETLSLVGGDIDVAGGAGTHTLRASGGRIQLGALAGLGEVPVDLSSFDPAARDAPGLGSVALRDAALLRVNTPSSGGIGNGSIVARAADLSAENARLEAANASAVAGAPLAIDLAASRAIELASATVLSANTLGAAPGGGIRAAALRIDIASGAQLTTFASNGTGSGGDIELEAAELRVAGIGSSARTNTATIGDGGDVRVIAGVLEISDEGQLSAETAGAGRGGDVRVAASSLRVTRGGFDPSRLRTRASGTGQGGDVAIEADVVEVSDGGELSALTSGAGAAGSLRIEARDRVLVRGDPAAAPNEVTGIFGRTDGVGAGGDLTIDTGRLDVEAGAVISARTFGAGAAGSVTIDAQDSVRVDGSEGLSDSLISVRGDLGAGGRLTLTADRVELVAGGALTSTATSAGDAGDVIVTAREFVASGVSPRSPSPLASGIYAETTENPVPGQSAGAAGDVVVDASERVRLEDGARLSARTRGPGRGGNIEVTSGGAIELASGAGAAATSLASGVAGAVELAAYDRVELESGASVTTEALFADGGNVRIRAGRLVLLRDASISAAVGSGEGAGGNVEIDPDVVGLVRSAISADAFGGPGGNVRIAASALFVSPDSAITASSSLGVQGTVSVDAPDTDLSGALSALPAAFVDRESLLRSPCEARAAGTGSFVARGSASLPPAPGGALGSEYGVEHWLASGAPALEFELDLPLPPETDVILHALGRCPGETLTAR
jgi:filamentous hemagglutinin family protein